MKRIFSLLLALVLVFGAAPAHAAPAGGSSELREWFYIDALGNISLTGAEALAMLGDMDEVILALEEGKPARAPDGQRIFYAPPDPALDMSVYDVLNFKGRGSSFTKMDGQAAVVESAYEAAEYAMYKIMSGTGYVQTQGSWGGVYSIIFKPDADMPYSTSLVSSLVMEIAYFVYAYFPHYFHIGISSTTRDGGEYLNTINILLAHTSGGVDRHWQEEYDEVELLVATSAINGGDKLKNVYDYLATTVTYNLNAPNNQEAYSALIGKSSVCNGYALSTSLLCLRMGLDVPYMTGDADGAHAWNLNLTDYPSEVLLVDATWGRVNNTTVSYQYFNKPLDSFRGPRSWSRYYESYIAYVHGIKDEENLEPGMVFGKMGTSLIIPSDKAPTIDLGKETIDLGGFTVAAYSVNGGKSWKKGELPDDPAKISKLFDKGLELWLAPTLDAKKKPAGVFVKFPKINPRPKGNAEKLKPYYGADSWALRTKTGGMPEAEYLWAPTDDKKNPSGAWQEAGHFAVRPGKTKTTILLRTPAKAEGGAYTPAGKIFKVTPANFGKEPTFSVTDTRDGRKIIKMKKDHYIQIGDASELVTVKKEIEVTAGSTVTIWKAETGKKPRSETQTLLVP